MSQPRELTDREFKAVMAKVPDAYKHDWRAHGSAGHEFFVHKDANISDYCVHISCDVIICAWAHIGQNSCIENSVLIHSHAWVGQDALIKVGAVIEHSARVILGAWVPAQSTITRETLQISGSREPVIHYAPGRMGIGCCQCPLSKWKREIAEIGRIHLYDPAEIREYRRYLDLVIAHDKATNPQLYRKPRKTTRRKVKATA